MRPEPHGRTIAGAHLDGGHTETDVGPRIARRARQSFTGSRMHHRVRARRAGEERTHRKVGRRIGRRRVESQPLRIGEPTRAVEDLAEAEALELEVPPRHHALALVAIAVDRVPLEDEYRPSLAREHRRQRTARDPAAHDRDVVSLCHPPPPLVRASSRPGPASRWTPG